MVVCVCAPTCRVRNIVQDVMAANSKIGMLKKVVALLVVIIILTLIAMFGVSLAAGVALKDTKLDGEVGTYNKAMLSTDGSPISVDVTETDLELFDLPIMSSQDLAYLSVVSAYVDMTAAAAVGGWVEYSAKLASAYKKDTDQVFLTTVNGDALVVDRKLQTASITMAGVTYPVKTSLDASRAARKLEVGTAPSMPAMRRRLGRRGGVRGVVTMRGRSLDKGRGNRSGND